MLNYVRKLNRAPGEVTRADAEAVLAAGWPERTLVQAAGICALFNMMNRWVEGLGIAGDPDLARLAGRMIFENGYAGLSDLLEAAR